ncbi:MAG: acyl-CoA desaturase, partial [Rubrivivax sp.]|nr:acyl-CoA desaturase [Pyrinomonadaceae bacterium]
MKRESEINNNKAGSFNWTTASFMIIFHLGAIAALFMFSWEALAVTVLLWWVAGSLGVGMGFHRLLT